MERRDFLNLAKMGLLLGAGAPLMGSGFMSDNEHVKDFLWIEKHSRGTQKKEIITDIKEIEVEKEEIVLVNDEYKLLKKTFYRLRRIQRTVGYGNFNVINFDDALKLARDHSKIGNFTKEEIQLIEKLFYENAAIYGFYGEKVLSSLTDNIAINETKKIPYTGHYLYRGKAEDVYKKIKKEIGSSIVLTSGVRGVVKQVYLFLNKARKVRGNLSIASRSLAPPGYSFHGIGDFDVGKVGLGLRNFSSHFAKTDEYKKLMDLGYIKIRYPQNNPYGVRFEPWHIKVT